MSDIPRSLFYDPELSYADKFIGVYVYTVLVDHIRPKQIMDDLKASNKTVVSSLGKLVDRGYLTRSSRCEWRTVELEDSVSAECREYTKECRNYTKECTDYIEECKNYTEECKNYTTAKEETEKENKKERSKERNKEREKEEGVRDIGNPNGLPQSETNVSDAVSAPEEISLSASEFLEDMESAEVKQCPYQAIQNMFNRICISYPRVRGIDGKRRQLVSGRWTSYPDLEVFRQVFENAESSSFMKGQGRNGWTADFDWMMKPSNFQKVLEGNYNDRPQGAAGVPQQEGDPFLAYMRKVMNGEA